MELRLGGVKQHATLLQLLSDRAQAPTQGCLTPCEGPAARRSGPGLGLECRGDKGGLMSSGSVQPGMGKDKQRDIQLTHDCDRPSKVCTGSWASSQEPLYRLWLPERLGGSQVTLGEFAG